MSRGQIRRMSIALLLNLVTTVTDHISSPIRFVSFR